MKKVLLALLALCLIVGIAACNDKPQTYTVTFDTQGGNEIPPIELNGEDFDLPADPVREGYTFEGWFFDKDIYSKHVTKDELLRYGGNVTVYAKWKEKVTPPVEKPKYDVEFDSDGGSAVARQEGVEEIDYLPRPTKTGYRFLGWFENVNDKNPVTSPYKPTRNITLRAKWSLIDYSITYNNIEDGTNPQANPAKYTIETSTITLSPAQRQGYTFLGWFDENDTEVTRIEKGTTGNLIVFAKWQVNKYKVRYFIEDVPYIVDGKPLEIEYEYNQSITFKPSDPRKDGFNFMGWSVEGGAPVPLTMPAYDLDIYGTFSPQTFRIIYLVDGKDHETQDVLCGEPIVLIDYPTEPNAMFSGWAYEGGEIPATMPARDIIVSGYFTYTFSLIYYLDGEVYLIKTYRANDDVEAIEDPQRTGYTFTGWRELPEKMPATDLEVFGSLRPNVYKLYFTALEEGATVSGATLSDENGKYIEVRYDENFIYRLTEVKGERFAYDFAGWTLNGQAFAPAKWEYTQDMAVIASWKEKQTQGLKFTLAGDGTYIVTGYSGLETEVFVPSTYKGVAVTAISNDAFRDNSYITMVTLHNGVSRLGTESFKNCTALMTVNLPASIKNIDAETFNGCVSLTSFTIPAGVSNIGNGPFRGCVSLEEILVAPGNSVYMSNGGVLYSSDAKSLIQYPQGKTFNNFTVPGSVETLGNYAFYDCTSLIEITLADTLKSIGCYVFAGTSVTEMIIPDSVTWIGSNAFDRCVLLEELTIPFVGSARGEAGSSESVFGYIFGNSYFTGSSAAYQWYDDINYIRYYLPVSLKSVIITDSRSIPYGAFSGCGEIRQITLENTVYVGEKAFMGCASLMNVSLPRTLISIANEAFNGCKAISSIELPASLTYIGALAFHNCPLLTVNYEAYTDEYENTEENIKYAYVLVEYNDNDRVSSVYITSYTGSSEEITVPGSILGNDEVVSIGSAFVNKTGIKTITLPQSITSVDRNAFAGSGLIVVYATGAAKPADWKDRWDDPAIYWKEGAEMEIVAVGDFRFYIKNNEAILTKYFGDSSVDEVNVPDTIQYYGSEIPVTAIGKYAFSGNSYIKRITIPSSVKQIASGAFIGCPALESIDVMGGMYFRSVDGVLYNYEGTKLIQYPANRNDGGSVITAFSIPANVTSIASMAFAYSALERVTFTAEQFAAIEAGAFMGSAALRDIINLDITHIAAIAEKAFYGCVNLRAMSFPATITSIGDSAFEGCVNLAEFNRIEGLDLRAFNRLTTIGSKAFMGCEAILEAYLPSSLVRIGASAFEGCESLIKVTMSDGVKAIGHKAFAGCVSLTEAKISSELARMSALMFEGCGALEALTIPFIGSARYANGTDDAVLGYLFNYSDGETAGAIRQDYSEGGFAYYHIPAGLKYVNVTKATRIPYGAFSNIASLEEIVISDTVTEMSAKALEGCQNLQALTIPFIGKSRNAEGAEAILGYLFAPAEDESGVTQQYAEGQQGHYIIPSGLAYLEVTNASVIGYGALYNVASLVEVKLNANIITIEANALYGLNALEALTIPFVGSARDVEGTPDAVFGYIFGYSDEPSAGAVQQYYSDSGFAYYFIPGTLASVAITSADRIPYGAFMNTSIEEVAINDGAEEIGERAFAGNTGIERIVLPNSITAIGDCAFDGANNLSLINLNRVRTIGDYAFRATVIQDLNIPNSVISIGEGAFSNMPNLVSVVLSVPNSNLAYIGDYAFENSVNLRTVYLPNALTHIGQGLFRGCLSLETISLPYIGANREATGGADAMLGYIFGAETAAGFAEITQYGADEEFTYYIPSSLKNIIITNALHIGEGALSGIPALNVTLNENLASINKKAFYMAQIAAVNIPASVVTIDESAFEGSALQTITFEVIGSRLAYINAKAFFGTAITSVSVPAGVLAIGDYAFANNLSLASVTFAVAAQLVNIGDSAFRGNTAITAITFPASLRYIGDYAFEGCENLAGITFAAGSALETLGDYAFAHTKVSTVALPASALEIGDYAFAHTLLSSISFGTNSALARVGSYAFAHSNLATFAIPPGVTYMGVNPFYETPVSGLNLSGYRSGYKVVSGVLFSKDGSVLISYPKSLNAASYTVPDGVVRIDAYAFASNTYLQTVSLPSGLLSIGFAAFKDCANLDTVSFRGGPSLLVIEYEAFYNCANLRIFDIPSTLTRIEEKAFAETDRLIALNLEGCEELTYIGDYAFENSGIAFARLPASLIEMGEGAFKGAYNLASVNLADTALGYIAKEAFAGANSLTGAVLPASVRTIGEAAFMDCVSLVQVSLNQTLSSIGDKAFYNTAIATIALPRSLESMGDLAFGNNASLKNITVPFVGKSPSDSDPALDEVFGGSAAIENITIANDTLEIAITNKTFRGITALRSLTLGAGIVSIEEGSLRGNLIIESLDLPFAGTSADAVGANAVLGSIFGFGEATDAGVTEQFISETESVYAFIPATLKTVIVNRAGGYGAFSNIASLQNLTVRDGGALGKNLIVGCTGLVSLELPFAGAGADAEGAESSLMYLTGEPLTNLNNIKLTSVTKLTTSAFPAGFNLKSIEISGDIASIPEGVFANCKALESVVLPFVGESASASGREGLLGYLFGFTDQSASGAVRQYFEAGNYFYSEIPASLVSVTVTGDSVVSDGAFSGMANLRTFRALGKVSIGDRAFIECPSLQLIDIGGNARILSIGDYAFYGAAFETITISADVGTIGAYAFANCHNLISVNFESGSRLISVGEGAFSGCDVLRQIALPDGVREIGYEAFKDCASLEEAVIPQTVLTMGEAAFEGCVNLVSLTLPFVGKDKNVPTTDEHKLGYLFGHAADNANVPIALKTLTVTAVAFLASNAIRDTRITALYLNEGIMQIGAYAACNTALENITIPASVLAIEGHAFENSALRSVVFASGSKLSTINEAAFKGCASLADIVIPDSVTFIGSAVFNGCPLSQRFSVPFIGSARDATGENAVLGYFFGRAESGGISQKYAQQTLPISFEIPTTLKNVTVTSATAINYGAFSGCRFITSISINSGVATIGALAFEGCESLETLTVPFVGERTNSVDARATMRHVFGTAEPESGISSVQTLVITSAVTIAENALLGMTGLVNLTLNNVTSIHRGAFSGCLNLENLTVPYIGARSVADGQEALLGYWFEQVAAGASGAVGQHYGDGAGQIAYARIPQNIRNITVTNASGIGYGALSGLSNLTTLTINKEVTSVGKSAFKDSGIQTLTVPFVGASRSATGEAATINYVFGGAPSNLTVVNITDAARIRTNSFSYNTRITTITLPAGLVAIESGAFSGLTALRSITIPASVTSIGANAFEGCAQLNEIIFAAGSQLQVIGAAAFKNTALTQIAIPAGVESIGIGIFEGVTGLERLTVPFIGASPSAAGQNALLGYFFNFVSQGMNTTAQVYGEGTTVYTRLPNNLYSVTVTNATNIASGAFYNCDEITELYLNSGIVSIGASAFANCKGLTSIVIPDSVTSIASGAFAGCSALESVTLPFVGSNRSASGAAALFGYIFGEATEGTIGATTQYFSTSGSRTFYIPEALRSIAITSASAIGYGAFYNLTAVTSITINEGITEIPAKAFYNCRSITSLTIPYSVNIIEGGSLEGTNSLVSLSIPFAGRSLSATGAQSQFGYIFGTAGEYAANVVKQHIMAGGTLTETLYNIPFTLRYVTLTKATEIKEYSFAGCMGIATVTLSRRITAIGKYAFADASSLSMLYGDFSELARIEEGAFLDCRSFLGLDLSEAPVNIVIGERAFAGCASLNYVNLPRDASNIGKDAFADSGIAE